MANWKLSDTAIKKQIADAKEKTRIADALEPQAKSAHYDPTTSRIVVTLSNGADFSFSPSSVQELVTAIPKDIAEIDISPSGRTLRWKKLDVDLSLPGLMMGVFGSKLWMAQLGQMGGKSTSRAKTAAARLNGKKGGRPSRAIHAGRTLSTSPSRTVRSVAGSALTQRRSDRTVRTVTRASSKTVKSKKK
ncbi:MAG: DUF2442 domain-containing protein [Pyrinomonadaceae bacterium]|nr:DUF2442 domain-containing protein [Pyrinomonadaceae bacterium]